jgi:hypothetical protein
MILPFTIFYGHILNIPTTRNTSILLQNSLLPTTVTRLTNRHGSSLGTFMQHIKLINRLLHIHTTLSLTLLNLFRAKHIIQSTNNRTVTLGGMRGRRCYQPDLLHDTNYVCSWLVVQPRNTATLLGLQNFNYVQHLPLNTLVFKTSVSLIFVTHRNPLTGVLLHNLTWQTLTIP